MAALAIELVIGLGGLLLTALFTPKPKDTYGSRLSNINVPPVSPGNVVPRTWGTMKVPAQMIFCSPLIETMHTHQASKKGGGKGSLGGGAAKTFTFTYSVDAAWGICVGPVYSINRIWANQKLLYVSDAAQSHAQADFDAAYQSEATRLIDEEGVDVDHAAASAFVFAWNNYKPDEVTLDTPSQAVDYIMAHPIDDTMGTLHQMFYPNRSNVTAVISQLYSGLNNQNTYLSQINRFDNIELYLGTDGQIPNGLLEGYLGQGNTPAFRNVAYFVITNLQLMDFGNSIPSMTVEVQRTQGGKTSLAQILTDVCYQSGLVDGQFDAISNVDSTEFPGFAVVSNSSAREIVGELQKVFPVTAAETGYKIIFSMLNKRPSQVFDRRDFGAHMDTEPLPASQEITVASDYDLPQRINLKFQEPARAYSVNVLYAARYNTPSRAIEDLDVTVALERATAQTAVNNLLLNRMFARRAYKMVMPRKYVTVEPTDVFRVPNKVNPAVYDQYFCTEVHVGANGLIEVHAVDHVYVDPQLKPSDQVSEDIDVAAGGNTKLPGTSQTIPFMLDLPFLYDTDADKPGYYVVLAGAFNSWQGGTLYVDGASPSVASAYGFTITTPTSGSAWQAIASSQFNIPHGVVLDKLAPGVHSCYWDRVSVITVRIANAMDLQSASEDDMLVQPLNVTVIGGEIVQYAKAEDLGNGLWRLSNFLRGLRGTERLIDGHVNGQYFVRLTAAVNRVVTTKADIGIEDSFQVISLTADGSTALGFKFTDTANCLKPYTVRVYRSFRDADGHVEVAWWPRVRQNGSWLSGSDVTIPANDSPETYQIDILRSDRTTVVRTVTIAGSLGGSFIYSVADQTADFGAPQPKVYLAIYMMSTIVGRGFGKGVVV